MAWEALFRRQNREPLGLETHVEPIGLAGLFLDLRDPGQSRAAPALRDHVRDGIGRSGKQRFDAAIPAVAYPALEMTRPRLLLDPDAVADALHFALDRDFDHDLTNRRTHLFLQPEKFDAALLHLGVARDAPGQLRRCGPPE